jgi:hypothetical protein
MKTEITAEMFEAATGDKPVNDDLERANCPDEGKFCHWGCGWNWEDNKPQWMRPSAERWRQMGVTNPPVWED